MLRLKRLNNNQGPTRQVIYTVDFDNTKQYANIANSRAGEIARVIEIHGSVAKGVRIGTKQRRYPNHCKSYYAFLLMAKEGMATFDA